MKLFVWRNVYCDHTPGMAWAIAEDSERARELITNAAGYVCADLAHRPEVYDLSEEAVGVSQGGG